MNNKRNVEQKKNEYYESYFKSQGRRKYDDENIEKDDDIEMTSNDLELDFADKTFENKPSSSTLITNDKYVKNRVFVLQKRFQTKTEFQSHNDFRQKIVDKSSNFENSELKRIFDLREGLEPNYNDLGKCMPFGHRNQKYRKRNQRTRQQHLKNYRNSVGEAELARIEENVQKNCFPRNNLK